MRSIFTRLKPNYPEALSASAPRDPSQVQLHAERITPGSPPTLSPIRIAYARGVCLQRASDVFANYLLVSSFPSEISSADRRRESLQLEEANYSYRSPGFPASTIWNSRSRKQRKCCVFSRPSVHPPVRLSVLVQRPFSTNFCLLLKLGL